MKSFRHLSLSIALAVFISARAATTTYDRYAPLSPNITWGVCDGFPVAQYQCATFDVPMDYANASAGKATLALVKLAYTATPRLGTLFVNPGGPGGSGVDLILSGEFQGFGLAAAASQYDVVSWDPRGIGATLPAVNCFNSSSEETAFWQNTAPQPEPSESFEIHAKLTEQDVQAMWKQEPLVDKLLGEVGQLCLQVNGDVLQYVGTVAVVRDLVGMANILEGSDTPINYYGLSYGTFIGSTLVNMFPDRVGKVILDGVVNPVLWNAGTGVEQFAWSIQDADAVFEGFASACQAAGPQGCAIADYISSSSNPSTSVQEWTNELLNVAYNYSANGGDISSAFIRDYIYSSLYTTSGWQQLAVNLTLWFEQASGSNASASSGDLHPRQSASNSTPSFVDGLVTQAVWCGDARDPGDVTTEDVFNGVIDIIRNESQLLGPLYFISLYCHKWPVRAVERYGGPWNHTLKNPIIVIGNKADPVTPIAAARLVAEMLGHSAVFLEHEGYGHTSTGEYSNCTLGVIQGFLSDDKYPAPGTKCPVDAVLFPTDS